MQEFFRQTFFGNTVEDYCWFTGILLAGVVLALVLPRVVTRFVFLVFKKYSTASAGFDKLFALVKAPLRNFVLLVAVYFAFNRLTFPGEWKLASAQEFGVRMLIYRVYLILLILSFNWIVMRVLDFFGLLLMQRALRTSSRMDAQLISFFKDSLKIIVSIFAFFFILGAVFHLNIASIIAGLGIGGLAVALAAKETLENLFGSLTIFLDKPFMVGDQVKIGNLAGQVEKIGFRSTRIRTFEKSVVTVPNKKMVEAEVDNLSLRMWRRTLSNLYLAADTPAERIRSIVREGRTFLDSHPGLVAGQSRMRFEEIGSGSVIILVLYFVDASLYTDDEYFAVREEINFRMISIVEAQGAKFTLLLPLISQK